MNVKQSLRTQVLTNEISHFFKGYWPTSDEIGNDKVKSLASRLKAESYKETLTNILEWQERNIVFWTERHPIVSVLFWAGLISIVTFFVGLFILVSLIVRNIQLLSLLSWFAVIWFVMLVSSIATTLAILIWIIRANRKFPWKEVPRGLKNVFWPNISMNFLLENRLGVCRDYAKLTACLLSNIYPNEEIYFASAPDHIATGINIENRLYMVDQRLPVLTKERWNDYRKPKKSDTIQRFDPIKTTLQKADKGKFPQIKDKPEPNTEKLAKRMAELLNIKEQLDDKANSLQKPIPIVWKDGFTLYEENEMTDYSLARFLANKISSEFVRMNQITRIETNSYKNDLIFQIYVRMDT
jgi:predicted transglutaminase-like protease